METLSPATDVLKKAKFRLLLSFPFFASMLFKLEHKWNEDIPTARTDGRTLEINPGFLSSLGQAEQETLLAHEVCHPMLLHHTRRENRDPQIWNEAADYAINLILVDSGFKLPKGGLIDQQYRGMSAEAIYELIKDKPRAPSPGFGEVVDFEGDKEEKMEEEYRQADSMIKANELAKLAGKGSSLIDQLIQEVLEPKRHWPDELRQIMTEKMKDDYSWLKPNTRYMGTGFFIPTLYNETFGMIALLWDTSGSTRSMQDDFAGELNSIKEDVNAPLQVVYFDGEVTDAAFFLPDEDLVINPVGGGGTDFRPPFEYLIEHELEPKVIIVFTDGVCWDFPEEPECDVIWAVCGNYNFNPPFGTVIRIE